MIVSTDNTYLTADSYVSLEEINLLLINNKRWEILTDEQKIFEIRKASLYIDGLHMYSGSKTNPEQILEFPRNGVKTVPQAIKDACIEIFKQSFFDKYSLQGGVIMEKIGNLEIRKSDKNNINNINFAYNNINILLSPYIANNIKINN